MGIVLMFPTPLAPWPFLQYGLLFVIRLLEGRRGKGHNPMKTHLLCRHNGHGCAMQTYFVHSLNGAPVGVAGTSSFLSAWWPLCDKVWCIVFVIVRPFACVLACIDSTGDFSRYLFVVVAPPKVPLALAKERV